MKISSGSFFFFLFSYFNIFFFFLKMFENRHDGNCQKEWKLRWTKKKENSLHDANAVKAKCFAIKLRSNWCRSHQFKNSNHYNNFRLFQKNASLLSIYTEQFPDYKFSTHAAIRFSIRRRRKEEIFNLTQGNVRMITIEIEYSRISIRRKW
jgi:hypothetical protein